MVFLKISDLRSHSLSKLVDEWLRLLDLGALPSLATFGGCPRLFAARRNWGALLLLSGQKYLMLEADHRRLLLVEAARDRLRLAYGGVLPILKCIMLRHFLNILCGVICFVVLALPARSEAVTIFAAASLKTALDEIAQGMRTDLGVALTISYGASSTIARQVELGAPADLIITANVDWMDHLDRAGRLAAGTRRDLLGNRLVLVANSSDELASNHDIAALLAKARLAMALVTAVPAGIYGKDALEYLGLWQDVAPRVVQTDNVRAALRLVARGEAPFGIVYLSDAQAEPGVRIVHQFAEESHASIRYPVAIVDGRDSPDARSVLTYLHGSQAAAIFEAQGFSMLMGAGQ